MRLLIGFGIAFLVLFIAMVFLAPLFEIITAKLNKLTKARYRIVETKDIDGQPKYIIQYRQGLFWNTYYIPGTGEPAVYYIHSEAEAFVEELVARGKRAFFKKTRKSKVYEYNDSGEKIPSKKK